MIAICKRFLLLVFLIGNTVVGSEFIVPFELFSQQTEHDIHKQQQDEALVIHDSCQARCDIENMSEEEFQDRLLNMFVDSKYKREYIKDFCEMQDEVVYQETLKQMFSDQRYVEKSNWVDVFQNASHHIKKEQKKREKRTRKLNKSARKVLCAMEEKEFNEFMQELEVQDEDRNSFDFCTKNLQMILNSYGYKSVRIKNNIIEYCRDNNLTLMKEVIGDLYYVICCPLCDNMFCFNLDQIIDDTKCPECGSVKKIMQHKKKTRNRKKR